MTASNTRRQRRLLEQQYLLNQLPERPATERVSYRDTYEMYRQWLIELALVRYKWNNLPATFNERFIEQALLFEGICSLSEYFSLYALLPSAPNMYGEYDSWQGSGMNGFIEDVNTKNGVLVYDSKYHGCTQLSAIEDFATRLSTIEKVRDLNLHARKETSIISAPEERLADAQRMWRSRDKYDPVIFLANEDANMKIDVSSTGKSTDYIGTALLDDKQTLWNEALTYLGIDTSNTNKRERLVVSEAEATEQHTNQRLLDGLEPRLLACEQYNKIYGTNISVEISKQNNTKENENEKQLQM